MTPLLVAAHAGHEDAVRALVEGRFKQLTVSMEQKYAGLRSTLTPDELEKYNKEQQDKLLNMKLNFLLQENKEKKTHIFDVAAHNIKKFIEQEIDRLSPPEGELFELSSDEELLDEPFLGLEEREIPPSALRAD